MGYITISKLVPAYPQRISILMGIMSDNPLEVGVALFLDTRVKIQNLSIEDTKNSKYLGEAPSTETSRWNQDILQDILKHWEAEALHKSLWLFGVPSIACRETLHT